MTDLLDWLQAHPIVALASVMLVSGCVQRVPDSAPVRISAPQCEPAEPAEACAQCPAPERVLVECRRPLFVPAPKIEWVPTGCPERFGACLGPEDAVRLREWIRDLEERHGR
jgi:hypothetical protein